jgi:uncharacterized protein YjiS (DUF1127 family)
MVIFLGWAANLAEQRSPGTGRKVDPQSGSSCLLLVNLLQCNIDQWSKGDRAVLAQNHIRSYVMYIGTLLRTFARWRRYRLEMHELAALDDRALSDIGLNRTMIRGSVYAGRRR